MKYNKIFAFLLFVAVCPMAFAQTTGTVSSYSRFGLGLLHDQSAGFNKSMGGAGQGIRIGNRINTTNPASYSAIDSLSLILDVGMSGAFGKMVQDTKQKGINSATFDYVHAGMHVGKRLGMVLGFMPYTTIGYDFSSPETLIGYNNNTTLPETFTGTYAGSGGLNQAYIGLGWKAFKNISIGANVSFMWGKYTHTLVPDFKEGGISTTDSYSSTIKVYNASLKTYKLDFGVQYPIRLTRQDWLNIGATAGLGHKIAQDATLLLYTTKGDTTTYTATSPFDLPYSYGVGLSWQHKNTLLVAADMHQERWGACRLPVETRGGYEPSKGYYKNMTKIAVGAQYTPDPYGKFWDRIQYRAGFNYSTPYLKVNGEDGPMELRLCAGAGIPIINRINSRSVVNVGVEWLRRSASSANLIKEDYFVLNLGVTFNERWFVKYKIE